MSDTKPSVSVILSTYREPLSYVRRAIESVFNQTLSPTKVIVVVDDVKNESVFTYLQQLAQSGRLTLLCNVVPQGLAACRNRGIAAASGEYIALMDADDIAHPQRFEHQLRYLQEQNLDAVFSHVTYIDDAQNVQGTFAPCTTNPRNDVFKRHLFAHPTGFFKRTVFAVEHYDPNFKRAQDVDLWIRLLAAGYQFGIVPQSLLQYRIYRNQSATDRITRQSAYAMYGFKIVKKHFARYWKKPVFWRFVLKWTSWRLFYLMMPKSVLWAILKLKDLFRVQ
jgi:glycosyltransferase involved in cell wall biosynthesis